MWHEFKNYISENKPQTNIKNISKIYLIYPKIRYFGNYEFSSRPYENESNRILYRIESLTASLTESLTEPEFDMYRTRIRSGFNSDANSCLGSNLGSNLGLNLGSNLSSSSGSIRIRFDSIRFGSVVTKIRNFHNTTLSKVAHKPQIVVQNF